VRKFVKIAAVQAIVFLGGLVVIECALAWFAPLPPHGGVYTDRNGKPARVSLDDDTLAPNLDIVHSASEFSASIHTNALGYRLMSKESATPDFLFLGDSFTFGHGVSDGEVFAEVFCKTRGASCLNLGRSGTDTFDQVRILRHGIDTYRLRPRNVVLTMLAACWLGVAGNDLGDNLTHAGPRSALPAPMRADVMPSPGDIVKAIQRRVVDFEITKRVMIIAASGLKTTLYSCSPQAALDAAQRATAVALRQLARLADEFGFKGFEALTWWGCFGPSGLPKEISERFARALAETLNDPPVHQRLSESLQIRFDIGGADRLREFLRVQMRTWGAVVRENDIKAE